MTRRVNYEDNIFYLTLLFKGIKAGLQLNIDLDLYKDRIIEDLSFLDRTAAGIFRSLKANHLMIDRIGYLKELENLNRSLMALLGDILKRRFPHADDLEGDFDLLRRVQANRETDLAQISRLIGDHVDSAGDQEQIVSEEEFKFLLSSETEEKDE